MISIHPPRVGWDLEYCHKSHPSIISIHPPRVGWDFADLVEDHLMCGAEITEKQYTEEVSFWFEEVENFNAGKTTETWGNPDEFEGWEARSELSFDYD